jgi:hypothetical protein
MMEKLSNAELAEASRKTLERQVEEKPFQQAVLAYLRVCGFLAWHVSDARRPGPRRKGQEQKWVGDVDVAGLPDTIAVHAGRRILLFLELKKVGQKPKPIQAEALAALDRIATDFGSAVALPALIRALGSGGTPSIFVRVLRPTREDWDWLEQVAG